MLQFHDSEEVNICDNDYPTPHSAITSCNKKASAIDLDEPTRMAYYLFNSAKRFISSGNPQILPAIKCLYMALSMVLAPQIEVELRLMLGNVLLDHTRNFNDALEQIQKAHQLAENSLGAIKFEEKCRITRSLIDALIRTNSTQLAQNILETISLEALQIQTPSAWNWFIHFSLMNLQWKLGEKELLHQALADVDGLLKILQGIPLLSAENDEEWNVLLASSKVLILSFLLIILTDDRKILSVFSIIPKASEELRQALNDLCALESKSEISVGTAFFGESLLLLNSLSFSNSSLIANGISNLLKLFERQQRDFPKLAQLKLPGNLIFLEFEEFKLFGDFLTLLTIRQSPGSSFAQLQEQIQRLIGTVQKTREFSFNLLFFDNLLMALNCFKQSMDLEAGIINRITSDQKCFIGDSVFHKKFRECLLSFTAHQVVGRLGIPKVVAFYDHKITSTNEVDLNNLMILNKALLTASTNETLERSSHALQALTNSVAFYLIRAIELKRSNSPAHNIRNVLNSAHDILKAQMYHEPKLDCIYHLLQGEFLLETDIETGRAHLQTAFLVAKNQLANKILAGIAAAQLAKSFKLTGDDELSEQWKKLM